MNSKTAFPKKSFIYGQLLFVPAVSSGEVKLTMKSHLCDMAQRYPISVIAAKSVFCPIVIVFVSALLKAFLDNFWSFRQWVVSLTGDVKFPQNFPRAYTPHDATAVCCVLAFHSLYFA